MALTAPYQEDQFCLTELPLYLHHCLAFALICHWKLLMNAVFTTLLCEEINQVLWVRLNRPDKHNAMTMAMIRELIAVANTIKAQRHLRAVVLQGAGPSFCSGMDLPGLFKNTRDKLYAFSQLVRPARGIFQKVNLIWRQLPVPVIALVHGHCFGAGMQLALGADWIIADAAADFSLMESKWGMIPDMGATLTLRGRVPPDLAKELMCTARVLKADTAWELGLISHVETDPQAAVQLLLAELAQRSPDAVAAAKRLVEDSWWSGRWRSLTAERFWQLRLLLGQNHRIAVERNRKKQDLPFRPRTI